MTSADLTAAPPPGYPVRWEADVVLSDGATMHIRPIVPDDAAGIEALHQRLSAETIYYRFFSPLPHLSPKMLDHLVRVDYTDRLALVGVLGEDLIGVARYERLPNPSPDGGSEAEVAFLVDDAHQGRGIGSILLEHLAGAAEEAGVTRFVADTLPDNQRMLRVFHEAGFGDVHAYADGVVRVAFPIQPTAESLHTMHEREQRAAARSVERLLRPETVAVIGVSRRETTLGQTLLRRLLEGGFDGPVYPVHPEAHHIASVRAWPNVVDIPDRVDLAVVITPAAAVAEVVADCGRKRVGGLVIISTGFAERDAAGLVEERRLVAEARRNGMRIIGPGSMGVVNTDPGIRLNATFSPSPRSGNIGFVAQSGGLGVVILDELARRGLGVSTFVSAGNKADVSGNDLLQFWDSDPATAVACMYIESFGNPRTFARVARRVSRHKPIVAVKSGRSPAGTRAAGLTSAPEQSDAAVDALFRQTGVIRTDTLEELFDVAQVLSSQPRPAGVRVAIVGNAGGPGVLAADACAAAGLVLPELSPPTREALARLPRIGASVVTNPVPLAPDATPSDFEAAVSAVLDDADIDACIAVCSMPLREVADAVADTLVAVSAGRPDKPLLACVLGRRGLLGEPGGRQVPSFAFAEAAARALGRIAGYASWLRRPPGRMTVLEGIDPAAAQHVVGAGGGGAGGGVTERGATGGGGADGWLAHPAAFELLTAYGIPVLPTRWVASADEAVAAARTLGYPVAVKADLGAASAGPRRSGVRLGCADDGAVRDAAVALGAPLSVQAMGRTDLDAVAGVLQDPLFGPLVTLARAGALGEPGRGRRARALPLTDLDAADLIGAVFGDGPPEGPARLHLQELLERLGRLAEDLPVVADLELNPILVGDGGATVAGARVCVAPWEPHPELALRRLR